MKELIRSIKSTVRSSRELPFAVYTSLKEQKLLNVPIVKPVLIVVLSGDKELGKNSELVCHSGSFIFLSDRPSINMRNIPLDVEYFALLIEFEPEDFVGAHATRNSQAHSAQDHFIGETTEVLQKCLMQFVESSLWAPQHLWATRRQEIIALLHHLGHDEVYSMMGSPKVGRQLHDIFVERSADKLSLDSVCERLAMSESTLRRKLKAEGTNIQEVKDQARLGLGLHLLQTSQYSIGLVAEKCGYLSQSRFARRFKGRFGLTPSELRKTKVAD